MTLQEFFEAHPKAALAFSGGVDSSYLLYAARQLGADVKAYYVKTAFQPEFEYQDALRLTSQLGADIQVLTLDVLACPDVTVNPKNRCYFCKQHIFGNILRQAKADGYHTVLDGTNASDQVSDRPGMKALQEMKVLSPLRLTGLTKAEIRRLSHEAEITGADLARTEWAEDHLMSLGFRDLRVRQLGSDIARIQLPEAQMDTFLALRGEITRTLRTHYAGVLLDMEARNGQ